MVSYEYSITIKWFWYTSFTDPGHVFQHLLHLLKLHPDCIQGFLCFTLQAFDLNNGEVQHLDGPWS